MYTTFSVKNFRCFDDLNLTDLKRVNLIAGKNNVGKTALLEALFLHCGAYNPQLPIRINGFRGVSRMRFELSQWSTAPWDILFGGFDTEKVIFLEGLDESKNPRSLRLQVIKDADELKKVRSTIQQTTNGIESVTSTPEPIRLLRLQYEDQHQKRMSHIIMDHDQISAEVVPPAPFQSVFLAARNRPPLQEEAERFTDLTVRGKKDLLLDTLKILDNRLSSLELLNFGGDTMIHGDVQIGRPVPLIFMGDGISRLASFVLAMGQAKDGVVLIDEVENGIHYSVLKDVWTAIGQAAREFNVQIFATTHSWECIVAAHRAFAEGDGYDFKYHRLDRAKDETIRAISYDQETLEASIDIGMEIR